MNNKENNGRKLSAPAKIIISVSIIILIILADRLSKNWIIANIALNDGFPVIKGFFNIVNVCNFGGAFSMFQNQKALFIAAGIFVPMLLLFLIKQKFDKIGFLISSSMIVGGAIGNLTDRLIYGYVIDFLQFGSFPVFNVADSFITVGVCILAICIIKEDTEKSKKENA